MHENHYSWGTGGGELGMGIYLGCWIGGVGSTWLFGMWNYFESRNFGWVVVDGRSKSHPKIYFQSLLSFLGWCHFYPWPTHTKNQLDSIMNLVQPHNCEGIPPMSHNYIKFYILWDTPGYWQTHFTGLFTLLQL